jgi:hypothetical protein
MHVSADILYFHILHVISSVVKSKTYQIVNMPQIHRPEPDGANNQPNMGDFLFPLTQPPAEDSHQDDLIEYHNGNAL